MAMKKHLEDFIFEKSEGLVGRFNIELMARWSHLGPIIYLSTVPRS